MTERAVVLSVAGRGVTVLCAGGAVKTVAWPGSLPSVGQEVAVGSARAGAWSSWAAAAAALVLLAGGAAYALRPGAPVAPAVVGVLSVDINPSIDLMVSPAGRVVGTRACDAAGAALLRANPGMRGAPVVAAVELAAAWSRRHGYLGRAHGVLMLAAWSASRPGAAAAVAADLRDAAAALRRQTVPGSVLALPLASGLALHSSERDGVSVGRYLLAHMLGRAPRSVARVPLAQLLQAWPPHTATAPRRTSPTSPKAREPRHAQKTSGTPPSSGAGQGAPVGTRRPKTQPAKAQHQVPKAPKVAQTSLHTVSGLLTGVGPNDVVVAGQSYPLAPTVDLTIGRAAAPFSLPRVLQALGLSVVLTVNPAGEVVALAAPASGLSAPVGGLP